MSQYQFYTESRSRPRTSATRPRTGLSTLGGAEAQQVICAVCESRGVAPTTGLAFVNLDTFEAVLSQIADSQTYIRTLHKLDVYDPSVILAALVPSASTSKFLSAMVESYEQELEFLDRSYWSDTAGMEYLRQFAFASDLESLKVAVAGNGLALCSLAAALRYIETKAGRGLPFHSLRIRYEPSEGSMMIDKSTIYALELIQNLRYPKSRDCLFGLLNETLTPMGARLLRSNILQPLTSSVTLNLRQEALQELREREEMFHGIRKCLGTGTSDCQEALKEFIDSDRLLTSHCASRQIETVQVLIDAVINSDIKYSSSPLDLRYQRIFAVKAGVNGLLDVARTTFRETSEDVIAYHAEVARASEIKLSLKYDAIRQYYFRFQKSEIEGHAIPSDFINVVFKKKFVECQTMELVKENQKINDSHQECMMMSDQAVQRLLSDISLHLAVLFKVSEGIGMLDVISSLAHVSMKNDYCRPEFGETLAIKNARHPIKGENQQLKYIPNDVYATQQSRFQIITGCNMSGKSTCARSILLLVIMAQIGSFVPASYARFPTYLQLFARVAADDIIDADASTFAQEMRETAFILQNVNERSIVIIDELGRGTSSRDGLAITIAIAEALVSSRATIWFTTHFHELPRILAEKPGVANTHLEVEMSSPSSTKMLYKITEGPTHESKYGLRLASLMAFPEEVMSRAAVVADVLEELQARRKRLSPKVVQQRIRSVILNVNEHLRQAWQGQMDETSLRAWLLALQKEFAERMETLHASAAATDNELHSNGDSDIADVSSSIRGPAIIPSLERQPSPVPEAG